MLTFSINLICSFYFFSPLKCYKYLQGWRDIYWNLQSLSGVTSLKKPDIPSNVHKLLIAPQPGIALHGILPNPCRNLSGSILHHCGDCCHSCSEVMCATLLSFPENTILPHQFTTSDSYSLSAPFFHNDH